MYIEVNLHTTFPTSSKNTPSHFLRGFFEMLGLTGSLIEETKGSHFLSGQHFRISNGTVL